MFYMSTINLPNGKTYYQLHHTREGYFIGSFSKTEATAKLDMLNSRLHNRDLLRSK